MDTSYTSEQQQRDLELSAVAEPMLYHFEPSRREVLAILGAGILLTATARAWGQAGGRGNRGNLEGGIAGNMPATLGARLHIGKDGIVTVLCGKVEGGQGVRAEVTQAAAEELRIAPARVRVVLADTDLVPNDGPTVGSQSTPRTIPLVRQAAAAARDVLAGIAAKALVVPAAEIEIRDGRAIHAGSGRGKTFAELAGAENLDNVLAGTATPRNVTVSAVAQWQVMGASLRRPGAADIVIGKQEYPSDVRRPGMVYGKMMRMPRYRSRFTRVDTSVAKAMEGVTVVQDGDFVGVTAPTTWAAEKALEAIKGEWQSEEHPDSATLAEYLPKHANVPANPFGAEIAGAAKVLKASYFLPYVQHAPLEPRAAVAEWNGGKLTVWTGTQQPFGIRRSIAQALRVNEENVRVIVPDFGGGFGGKHTDECAVEAARLARGAGKPVCLRWTREEEFTWAYFRPAGVMQCEASLDGNGRITSWYFININSGPAAVQTPYTIARNLCQTVNSAPPLRHGSYRALAATANAWARECFMEECAAAAGRDSVEFRLAHLQETGDAAPRLRDVLLEVAKRFDWAGRKSRKGADVGIGIACATEKGSYTATAAQVSVNRENGEWKIDHLAHVFECGKVINPYYCRQQVEGAIIQGLGPILREAMEFEGGRMLNGTFTSYKVPRFADVPSMDVFLLDRPDLASAGAGETPLITVAPAVANAVSMAVGSRVRELPLRVGN
jgi:isoquinoline 1-oxidoreductase